MEDQKVAAAGSEKVRHENHDHVKLYLETRAKLRNLEISGIENEDYVYTGETSVKVNSVEEELEPHGQGTMIFRNFRVYTGSFDRGKRHGTGRISWPLHDFSNEAPAGTQRWSFTSKLGEGGHRIRQHKDLNSPVVGLLEWEKYAGNFVLISDTQEVDGVTWLKLHKSCYEVMRKNDYFREHNIETEGWCRSNDTITGDCYLVNFQNESQQEVYDGEWRNDMRWGTGRYLYPDGSVFEGQFEANVRGKGFLISPTGERKEVGVTSSILTNEAAVES